MAAKSTGNHLGRMRDYEEDRAAIARVLAAAGASSTRARALRAGGSSPSMARLGRLLRRAPHNLVLRDVEYDGNCVAWSVLPALARYLGQPLSVEQARRIVVASLRKPVFAEVVAGDLRATNSLRAADGEPPLESPAALFAEWCRDGVYLPPLLAARAVAWFTGKRVRVWALDADGPTVIYESDGDAPVEIELAYDAAGEHMARLLSLEHYEDIDAPRRAALADVYARKRPRIE